jgi:futalosine hydrolase
MNRYGRILIVVAVPTERHALGSACLSCPDVCVEVSGIGRTNAAAAVAEAVVGEEFAAVVSVGIAGLLPGSPLRIGQRVVATECVYAEEGVQTPEGFKDMEGLGFPLGDFQGNRVPVCPVLLAHFAPLGLCAPVATVATCSGTNSLAAQIAVRTGAVAEAMEGAAVVHAARRFAVPAIELRCISNTTGDRALQEWDLKVGLAGLGEIGAAIVALTQTRR